ncbi:MAG: hypothetical protein R3C05_26195 [Pirellulaceae bacterium]
MLLRALVLWTLFIPRIVFGQSDSEDDLVELEQWAETLLLDRKYAELDEMITSFRKTQSRSESGFSKLSNVYKHLAAPWAKRSRSAVEDRLRILKTWSDTARSVSSDVCLAFCYMEKAWEARGGGFYGSITGDEIEIMRQAMEDATKALDSAEALCSDDRLQDACISYLRMCVGHLTGADHDEMLTHMYRGLEIDPWYWPPISAMTVYLLPQWYGSQEALLEFAEAVADATRNKTGDGAYALVVMDAINYGEPARFGPDGFDWQRTLRGLNDWVAQRPDSTYRLGATAKFAHLANDREAARSAIERLEGRWTTRIWPKERDFERTVRWAFDSDDPGNALSVIELGPRIILHMGLVDNGRLAVVPRREKTMPVIDIESGKRVDSLFNWPHRFRIASHGSYGKYPILVSLVFSNETGSIDTIMPRESIGRLAPTTKRSEVSPVRWMGVVSRYATVAATKFYEIQDDEAFPYQWSDAG